jgi:hypothetical protein
VDSARYDDVALALHTWQYGDVDVEVLCGAMAEPGHQGLVSDGRRLRGPASRHCDAYWVPPNCAHLSTAVIVSSADTPRSSLRNLHAIRMDQRQAIRRALPNGLH